MRKALSTISFLCAFLMISAGCATAPKTENAKDDLKDSAEVALKRFERMDSSLAALLDKSAGYAVFPSIGKGGLGVGGAYGKGVVYEHGTVTGYCDLSQASVGFQAGGQDFAELLVFNSAALNQFKGGTYDLGAEASAIAIKPGVSAQTELKQGVAIFTSTNAGLMYEAAIAGQKFRYSPTPQ